MSHVNANLQVSMDTLIATVKDVVENRKMVAAVYLLSSHQGDKIKKGVELNLALLMNRFFYKRDRRESYTQTLFAESEIKNRLGISVNIILLNSSPIVSIYHMITTGKCIFEQYRSERISYEIAAKSQYYDLHPFVAASHRKTTSGCQDLIKSKKRCKYLGAKAQSSKGTKKC